MELPVTAQALQAACSLLFGAAVGLLYDFNRALRRECRRGWMGAAADAVFCLVAAGALFAFAMAALDGRLRLAMLCCAAAGWGVYLLTLSRPVGSFFSSVVKSLGKMLKRMGARLAIIKKIKKIEKNIFSKLRIRFKMVNNRRRHGAGKNEGSTRREARKGRYDYSSGGGRPHGLRSGGSGLRRGGDREIQHCEGRARREGR